MIKKIAVVILAFVTFASCSKGSKVTNDAAGDISTLTLQVGAAQSIHSKASVPDGDTVDEGIGFDRLLIAAFRQSGTNDNTVFNKYYHYESTPGGMLNDPANNGGIYITDPIPGYTSAVTHALAFANLDESLFSGAMSRKEFEEKTIGIETQSAIGVGNSLAMTGGSTVIKGATKSDGILDCSSNISMERLVSRLEIRINDQTGENQILKIKGVYLSNTLPRSTMTGKYSGEALTYNEEGKAQFDIKGRFTNIPPYLKNEAAGMPETATSLDDIVATGVLPTEKTRFAYNFFPNNVGDLNHVAIIIAATFKQGMGEETVVYYRVNKFTQGGYNNVTFKRNVRYALNINIQEAGGPTIDVVGAEITATVTPVAWVTENLDAVIPGQ